MTDDLTLARLRLQEDGLTCAVCGNGTTFTSTERGVKPLVKWLESGLRFDGCSAADKVVGRATAFLYVLLGVTSVYAHVISESATEVLKDNGINVFYSQLVPHIVNRSGTGVCPFEQAVSETSSPSTAHKIILQKLGEMGISL